MLERFKRIISTVETAPDKRPVEINEHLQRCLVDIDLNMVRARVVTHPGDWTHSGYRREIQKQPQRYGMIDPRELAFYVDLLASPISTSAETT